jgi:hypothetical protein
MLTDFSGEMPPLCEKLDGRTAVDAACDRRHGLERKPWRRVKTVK